MYSYIIELMQLGASLPREKLLRIVEIAPLVHRITDASMAEGFRQGADRRFTEAMDPLSGVHFGNPIDAGTIYQLKPIPCLLTNPHASDQPVRLAL
jgi:hypothetical protein